MRVSEWSLVAACYDKSCAPPPVGKGGSSKGGSSPAGYLRLQKRSHQLLVRRSALLAGSRKYKYTDPSRSKRYLEKAIRVGSQMNQVDAQMKGHPARSSDEVAALGKVKGIDDVLMHTPLTKGLRGVIDSELPMSRSDVPTLAARMDRIREAHRGELVIGEDLPKSSAALDFTTLKYRNEGYKPGTPVSVWHDYYLRDARPINLQALGLSNKPAIAQQVSMLDAFIAEHAEPVTGSLLRGIRSNSRSAVPEMSVEVGGTFTMRQFGSWTSNAYTARRHAGGPDMFDDKEEDPHETAKRTQRFSAVIRMADPSGLRGIPGNLTEAETILPRNTTFKVTGVQETQTRLPDGTIGVFRVIDVEPA